MKETGYKIRNRVTHERKFDPISFICTVANLNEQSAKGSVAWEGNNIPTETMIHKNYVHTLGTAPALKPEIRIHEHDYKLFPGESLMRNDFGQPFLKDKNGTEKVVSLSHDGDYFAMAYCHSK